MRGDLSDQSELLEVIVAWLWARVDRSGKTRGSNEMKLYLLSENGGKKSIGYPWFVTTATFQKQLIFGDRVNQSFSIK